MLKLSKISRATPKLKLTEPELVLNSNRSNSSRERPQELRRMPRELKPPRNSRSDSQTLAQNSLRKKKRKWSESNSQSKGDRRPPKLRKKRNLKPKKLPQLLSLQRRETRKTKQIESLKRKIVTYFLRM